MTEEKTIERLERELREAKLRAQYNKLLKDLETTKVAYEGKSFGNRRMSYHCICKYKLETEIHVVHIDTVYISTGSYSGDFERDSVKSFEEFCVNKDRAEVRCYGESIIIRKEAHDRVYVSRGKLDCKWKDVFYDSSYEITDKVYNQIRTIIDTSLDNIFVADIKEFPDRIYGKEDAVQILKDNGQKLIELDGSEVYVLENHPFLYGKYLLVNEVSRNIINVLKKKYEEEARRDVGMYIYGEYVRPSGIAQKKVDTLTWILERMK